MQNFMGMSYFLSEERRGQWHEVLSGSALHPGVLGALVSTSICRVITSATPQHPFFSCLLSSEIMQLLIIIY